MTNPSLWHKDLGQDVCTRAGVSLGLTTNRRGTCAIIPDGDGHIPANNIWLHQRFHNVGGKL